MNFISQLIKIFIKDSEKFNIIKNSGKSEKSIYFAIVGILSSVLGIAVSLALILCGVFLIESMNGSGNILVAIFGIIAGAAVALSGGLGLIMCSIRGMIVAIYQLKLNRKPIGVIALILNIVIMIAIIILIWVKLL